MLEIQTPNTIHREEVMFQEILHQLQQIEGLTIQMEHEHHLGLQDDQQLGEHPRRTLQRDLHHRHQDEVQARFTDNLHEAVQATILEDHLLTTPTHQGEALAVQDQVVPFQGHPEVIEVLEAQDLQVVEEDVNIIY